MKRTLAVLLLASGCVTPGGVSAPVDYDVAVKLDDGTRLRVYRTGDGDGLPVILVHGYGSRLETWSEVQRGLEARVVVSYDQRGFGLSDRPKGAYGPNVHARDLIALMDDLGYERAVLAGHSYGGGVVLEAARLAPDRVAGILLVSAFALEEQIPTSFRWAQVPVVGELIFGAFYKEVPGEKYVMAFHDKERFVTLEALDEMRAIMSRPGSTYAALETVRGMTYDSARYREIEVPIRIVWGREDRVLSLEQGRALAAATSAPLTVIEGCGHVPAWEAPREVVRALNALLDEVER